MILYVLKFLSQCAKKQSREPAIFGVEAKYSFKGQS